MDTDRHIELLKGFQNAKVLVVGDLYLDENVFGKVTGVSLEAPIQIFEIHERKYNPGAAGNAAGNIAALGATTYVVGVVGADVNASILREEFERRNVDCSGLVVNPTRPTNTYGKLKAGGFNIPDQEILRTDTPTPPFIEGEVEDAIIEQIEARAASVDAIVVTDQVCSVATSRVLKTVVECAKQHNLITVGDSRSRIGEFAGFTALVPNDREAGIGVGIDIVDEATLMDAGNRLAAICKHAIVTRGADGITTFQQDAPSVTKPSAATLVADVTGAGDTVTAAITLSLVSGATAAEAAVIGNAAASVAVGQRGVVAVTHEELSEVTGPASHHDEVLSKTKTLDELAVIVKQLKAEGKKVIWTNGCFDILHTGHIMYLIRAAREGDVLILGLNSDASVRAVKGEGRPVHSEDERALQMSCLQFVDYVVIFSDDTPAPIIHRLHPDVYTKGGDYTIDTINQEERRIVEGYGGRVAIIPGIEGRSTTNIIDRLSKEYDDDGGT